MNKQGNATISVVVKLRELDTDERTTFRHDVAPPRNPGEEQGRLAEAVAVHKPSAEFRSFSDHTASFVDSNHLIVAYYENPEEIRRVLKLLASEDGQGELFAASREAA
jgi:hypothetical protein